MSVYIKGMEMPTSCEKCPCKTADAFGGLGCQATGYIPLRKVNQNRPDWCPLIPVPPHGRLIDADALKEYIINGFEANKDLFSDPFEAKAAYDIAIAFCKDVDEQPTIIEEER